MTAAEEVLQFETADGISHLAVVTTGSAGSPMAALFIPAAGQTRTGPERLHVRLAREWARLGIPSLRFDAPDGGDGPPGAASDALAVDSACAAAQALRNRYPEAGIVLTAFGRAAVGAVRIATALAQADVRLHAMCLINPMMGDIPLPSVQPWWRRMLGALRVGDTAASSGTALPAGKLGDHSSVWQSLPELLRRQNMRLLVVSGGGEHAHTTLEALADSDRNWRQVLRTGSMLRLDGVDRYLIRPVHWQAVNGWLQRQLAG